VRLLFEIVVAATAGGTAFAGSVALVMRRHLHRAGRLVPDRAGAAPLGWRWSPRRAAVLHRRLQRSCQVVLAAIGGPSAYRRRTRWRRHHRDDDGSMLRSTGRALLDRALALDDRLVAADRGGPAWLRLQLPGLATEIAAIEASAFRLAELSRAFDEELDAAALGDGAAPELQLDAMEAAIADLGALGGRPRSDTPTGRRRP
jgi:hypothetical protein